MSTESSKNFSREAPQWMRHMFEELKNMFEGLFPDADELNLEEMQQRLDAQQAHRRKTANDRWGGERNGAGRPAPSWKRKLGPARFGSYRKPVGGRLGVLPYLPPEYRATLRPRKM
jgi:hypothetical protein